MNRDYQKHFDIRGLDYHQAMELFPEIRDLEFRQLFDGIDISSFQTVIDLPSGGSYLAPYLPKECRIIALDPATGFHGAKESVQPVSFEELELPQNAADAVVTLAAMHHLEDPSPFLENVRESLKKDAVHLIGDVRVDSPIAHFLDDFCGENNGMGHKGYFLPDSSANFGPLPEGLVIERYETIAFPWKAQELSHMVRFCRGLFGLIHLDDRTLEEGLKSYLNLRKEKDSFVIDWELIYLRLRKID